ncbi:MAG: ABC-2 transporter permease [Lachnospiraceae bacterium]
MAGLLYKDFIAVKGRIYVLICVVHLQVLCALRVFVTDGESVDISIAALLLLFAVVMPGIILFNLETAIIKADDGRKQKQYYLSLPISRKGYVAEKYIMLLLMYYVVTSFICIEIMLCKAGMVYPEALKMVNGIQSLFPVLIGFFLIISSIELPFFLAMGTKRGLMAKTSIVLGLFFLGIVFMLFGDLTILDRIDFISLITYLQEHYIVLLVLQILFPVLAGGIYFLSYRLSCRLFGRKEWEDD